MPLPHLNNDERKKTCMNVNCPERTGGECTAGEMNTNREEELKEIHLKWLSKTKTAKIDGVEMTVLPYGYLTQAVEEALQSERKRMGEEIEGIINNLYMGHIEKLSEIKQIINNSR